MKKFNKKSGIFFWITGLPGSGKTTIAKNIHNKITRLYGPTILLSGDDIRKSFNLKSYDYKERIKLSIRYSKFAKRITKQKINVIYAVVALFEKTRKWNRKNFDNYLEIYIKSDIKKIIKQKKKKIYHKKNIKNIWGKDLKPEFPKKPNIIINNNFKLTTKQLSNKLFKKISNY